MVRRTLSSITEKQITMLSEILLRHKTASPNAVSVKKIRKEVGKDNIHFRSFTGNFSVGICVYYGVEYYFTYDSFADKFNVVENTAEEKQKRAAAEAAKFAEYSKRNSHLRGIALLSAFHPSSLGFKFY